MKKYKKLTLIVLTLIIIFGIIFILFKKSDDNAKTSITDETTTTSTAATAQEDFSGGDDRPVLENNNSSDKATITDNSGQNTAKTDSSTWTSSENGDITIHSPTSNQTINSGFVVSGESRLSNVQFRVIDDVSGVISEGSLSVVNGLFSGTINYSSTAIEGRLDVFATRDDGSEYGNIELPIRFK